MSGQIEQARAMRAWVLEHVVRAVLGLDHAGGQAALIAAGAWQRRNLRELHAISGHIQTRSRMLTTTRPWH